MRADQAIYTSLPRSGREGYHVVSRSPGVSESDARTLASWCPSHGALIVDETNRASVNIHPLTEGRMVVSRSCEGPPEYSGRGGRQIYTHIIIFEIQWIERRGIVPISLYFDALALGVFRYRAEPETVLHEVELSRCHRPLHLHSKSDELSHLNSNEMNLLSAKLASGKPIELHHPGDRVRFAEHLLGRLPIELAITVSLSTSLKPSTARPVALCLIP
nr:hypothetical protein [Tautonia marina]